MTQLNLAVPPVAKTRTNVRYGVLGFACALSMITYLDRVCFSTAMPHLVKALGFQNVSDLKWAVTALAGFVYQAGFLFLTGLGVLILVRFLFGMGEAGAYPNLTRALHNWFPMT